MRPSAGCAASRATWPTIGGARGGAGRAPLEAAALDARPAERNLPADEALAAAESARAVGRAMAALPEKHRVVLALREVEGLSYEEIAVALGVPIGTVESRLHRARAGLGRRLADEEGR